MAEQKPELQSFLENPSNFDQIASNYDDEVKCYLDLLDNAKKSLGSFNEYHRFLTAATQHGPTDFVYYRLNRNGVRSIKNMILGSSRAGRQFPISSLEELQERIEAYQELGVKPVEPQSVIFTLFEHLLDSETNQRQPYHIINSILNQENLPNSEVVSFLVQIRLVLALQVSGQNESELKRHTNQAASELPDPLPDDDRDGEELLDAAKELPYGDSEKLTLAQSSFVRTGNNDSLIEYLYFTAVDIPERYRHRSQDTPWLGELQLARIQFQTLSTVFSEHLSNERKHRCISYRYLISGEIMSGGRWRSQRDPENLPEANFEQAAAAYLNASNAISVVDPKRQIKYLSKALRHQATDVRHSSVGPMYGWDTCRAIHEQAKSLLTQANQRMNATEDIDHSETTIGLIPLHDLYSHRASAIVSFQRGEVDLMKDHINSMWDILDSVRVFVDRSLMEDLNHLHEGLQMEKENEFAGAQDAYERFDHRSIDLEQRRVLMKLKKDVHMNDYDSAISNGSDVFNPDSPIMNALSIMKGDNVSSISFEPPILPRLFGTTDVEKLLFCNMVQLTAEASNESDALISSLEETFFNL